MTIEVLEIHHHAVRIEDNEKSMQDTLHFYRDVLGMGADPGRPNIPGVPGYWMNVGEAGQIHIIAGSGQSKLAKGPGQDPTVPHIALAVADIVAAKAELDSMKVPYWSITLLGGPASEQIFFNDPGGNMIELHQIGACRCVAKSRIAK